MAKKEKNDTRYKISKGLYKKWQQIFYKEETRDYAVKYALTYIKKIHMQTNTTSSKATSLHLTAAVTSSLKKQSKDSKLYKKKIIFKKKIVTQIHP